MQFGGSSASREGQFKIGIDTFYHVEDAILFQVVQLITLPHIIFSSDPMKKLVQVCYLIISLIIIIS